MFSLRTWISVLALGLTLSSVAKAEEFKGKLNGKDLFEMIGVDPNLEPAQFEAALREQYRAASKRFHPNANGVENDKAFRAIKSVYDLLLNPDFRSYYRDTFLKNVALPEVPSDGYYHLKFFEEAMRKRHDLNWTYLSDQKLVSEFWEALVKKGSVKPKARNVTYEALAGYKGQAETPSASADAAAAPRAGRARGDLPRADLRETYRTPPTGEAPRGTPAPEPTPAAAAGSTAHAADASASDDAQPDISRMETVQTESRSARACRDGDRRLGRKVMVASATALAVVGMAEPSVREPVIGAVKQGYGAVKNGFGAARDYIEGYLAKTPTPPIKPPAPKARFDGEFPGVVEAKPAPIVPPGAEKLLPQVESTAGKAASQATQDKAAVQSTVTKNLGDFFQKRGGKK